MEIREIFVNRHSELRAGWKLSIFALILGMVLFALVVPFQMLGVRSDFVVTLNTVAGILAVSFIMVRKFHHKPFTAIGLSLHPVIVKEVGIGCLLGVLMMGGIFLLEYSLGYAERYWLDASAGMVLWTIISSMAFFIVAAVAEELLFRGYPFQVLIQGVSFLPAMLIMAFLFGMAHLANPHASVTGFVNTALAAILFSVAYMKTRSLWLPFGLHFSWNFAQTTLFGFPTSGISFSEYRLFRSVQTGPDWVTGGPYGPEAGILATVALVAAMWYILKAPYLAAPEGIITLDSVEDLLPPREGDVEPGEQQP
jgi:membrane protease YdiL (CAAX protease family)